MKGAGAIPLRKISARVHTNKIWVGVLRTPTHVTKLD